jgi:O-antigen/teichoic acid export membrane protein
MLFVALLIFFILQPFLTATPFPVTDFIVIAVMGLVCFIPFGLFVRGVLNAQG